MPPPVLPPTQETPTSASVPADLPTVESTKQERDFLEPGETLVTVVHRHPIGIAGIYLGAFVTIIAVLAIATVVAPGFFSNLSDQAQRLLVALIFAAVGLMALVLFVATYIYRQSKLLVTNKSLVQIVQSGLFIRKVSRLSMSNVEDVNAEHRGILSTIFNYGVLTVQTAGQEDNFIFPWCPDPELYADRVLEARQVYAQSIEELTQRRAEGRPI